MTNKQGWGRNFTYSHHVLTPRYETDLAISETKKPLTVYAQGRSYGDVALNDNGTLIDTGNLNRFIFVDWQTGIIKAEAGTTLDQILRISLPHGWFLPVTPGTKYVSLGGAVANDVHGKNHHLVGSFGAFVQSIDLMRSNGERLTLSPHQNTELFEYTISGLGLTGFILAVEIQLQPIQSSYFDVENIQVNDLNEFFELSEQSQDWEYTVSWLDCFAKHSKLGKGIFTRANHVTKNDGTLLKLHNNPKLKMPIDLPSIALNKYTISAFNFAYARRPSAKFKGKQHYNPFLYPLDGIQCWNRLYGKSGFFQYQAIIPREYSGTGIREMLDVISKGNMGSFLAVLKIHGDEKSPGKNSFSLNGTSLALDFPNRGEKTKYLFRRLDKIVEMYNGRLYPAKDSLMPAKLYKQSYPNWQGLQKLKDPAIESAFWKRVTESKSER